MATYTFDKIEYGSNTYVVSDSGALQLTGGQVTGPVTFGDSVSIDEVTLGDLVVNGSASFTNNIQANTINGVTVGSSPKFTDTNTEVSAFTLATSTGTSSITLASAGKYVLTAGSKNIIFTMPTIPTVPSNIVNTITTTAGAHTAITSQKGNVSFNVPTTAAHVGIKFGYTTSGNNRAVLQDSSGNLYVTQKDDNSGGTITGVTAGTGLSGGGTSGSVTLNHSNSVTAQTTQAIYPIKIDAQGHISAYGDAVTPLTSHQTIKQDGITGATGNHFGTCSIAAGTAAKTVSITAGTPVLEAGLRVTVKFTYANTAGTPTLNVNSLGAKNIFHNGAQITTGANKALLAGTVEFVYDGTQWQLIGNYIDTDTKAWGSITGKPTATGSNTTGITASTTATKTTLGTADSVIGVQSTTTTASKASGANGSASTWAFEEVSIPNVTAAGSASTWAFTGVTVANSISGAVDTNDSTQLNITLGTTTVQSKSSGGNGSAPTLGTAIKVQSKKSGANGTAPSWSFTDVTVPIKDTSATSIPNVSVASATVSITDNGHTHLIS